VLKVLAPEPSTVETSTVPYSSTPSAAPTDYDIRTELYEVGGPGSPALCRGRFLWAHVDSPVASAMADSRSNIGKAVSTEAIFVDEIIVSPVGLGVSATYRQDGALHELAQP